jgi:HEAT repeat protein
MPRIPAALVWIVGQSLTLGIELAFLVVPGNAVFLTVYGAERLPYVYLLVAALGAVASYGITALQERLGLYQLSIGSTLIVAALTVATWALLYGGADWASAGALMLFALQIQLGFVFIGAQAGRAFDLQELKRVFSWIVAAFVIGFMVGGFIAARFVDWGGQTVHLLAVSAGLALLIAGLMVGASRHVHEPVHEPVRADAPAAKPPSMRQILAVPLIRAVFIYQILSAIVTQLVEYLLYDRAAARYPAEEDLARFLGQFTAVLNLVDLVVLLAFGGLLMARFGLRYGLSINPILVSLLIAAGVAIAAVVGPAHLTFFLLMAVARITDITTTDAAGRTSINATFKALPTRQRLAAQVGVEAAGVPIALGLTALMILAINALPGASVEHVALATLVLCLAWCAMTVVVYRRYQEAVVSAARRRVLDGDQMDLAEPTTRTALLDLMRSGDPRDIRVALSHLGTEREVEPLVRAAAEHPSLEVQRAVAGQLSRLDPALALAVAGRLVRSKEPGHAVDGLRLIGAMPATVAAGDVEAFLAHEDGGVRAAAAGTLLRAGSARVSESLAEAMRSPDPAARAHAAQAIAEAGRTPSVEGLAALIADDAAEVRSAATAAVAALNDDQRLALLDAMAGRREAVRVIRACRSSASPAFCAGVAARLAEDRAETPDLVRLLNAAKWRAGGAERAAVDGLIERETERIGTAVKWRDALAASSGDAVERLRRALAQEAVAAGRHLTDLLGLVYDRQLMNRVGRVLEGATQGDAGISIESLDLALAPHQRGKVIRALKSAFAPEPAGGAGLQRDELAHRLGELARDCRWAVWPDWLLACTLAALAEAQGSQPEGLAPLGPVSAELLRRA